jgi:hypothetical protein
MDGIAALATTANIELVNRINSLEKENTELKMRKLIFYFSAVTVIIVGL